MGIKDELGQGRSDSTGVVVAIYLSAMALGMAAVSLLAYLLAQGLEL